jgi:TP901 family phage tail tape measure protein
MATKIGTAFFDVSFNTVAARRELSSLVSSVNRQFGLIGGALSVGVVLAIGAVVKATFDIGVAALQVANEYEQAFARVRKTVDDGTLSVEEATRVFGELDEQLRQIALDVPLDLSSEIAKIAELGGQLGVATEDLEEFTRVIGEVGVTTNISVEDAATGFARFANITGTAVDDFRDLADAVVHLGNRLPTTEDEILRFSLRTAAAGEIVGFTEDQIFALSAAMSSVGIPAERGGTAIQRTLLNIDKAVATSSGLVAGFADVAGLSAEEFAEAWRTDPAEAFTLFIEGLGRAGDQGFVILQGLRLAEQRTLQSLLSIAAAGPLLRESFELGADAAGSLATESGIFFSTTQANIQLLQNTVENAGLRIGEALQGPFNDIVDTIERFIKTNPALIDQIGQGLGSALDNLGNFIRDNLPLFGQMVVNTADMAADWLLILDRAAAFFRFLGIGGDPELQDMLEREVDRILQEKVNDAEKRLRRAVEPAQLFPQFEPQVDEVAAVADVLIDLRKEFKKPLDADIFKDVLDNVDFADTEMRALIELLEAADIEIPVEFLLPEITDQQSVTSQMRENMAKAFADPTLLNNLRQGIFAGLEQDFLIDEIARAKEFGQALGDLRTIADDVNVPFSVLVENAEALAPHMQEVIDKFGAGELIAADFDLALQGLENALTFDLSDVTEEFELLMTVTNKAGEEVPATINQMFVDMERQAQARAAVEAGTLILDLLGFDDLAAQIRSEADVEAAAKAVNKFVNDVGAAAAQEELLDKGGTLKAGMRRDLVEALQTAVDQGTITSEMARIVTMFTSEEVQLLFFGAASTLAGLFGQDLLDEIARLNDLFSAAGAPIIKVPVQLVPEILGEVPIEGAGGNRAGVSGGTQGTGPGTGGAGSRGRTGGRTGGRENVQVFNFNSPGIPTADVVRAAQIAASVI